MTENIALFLIPVIKALSANYGYDDKWTMDKMNKSILYLPVTNEGVPDWAFMEEYIVNLRLEVDKEILFLMRWT